MRRLIALLRQHGLRICVTLIPVAVALLHAGGVLRLPMIDRLDDFLADSRLRTFMPGTLDPRIIIVDIDERSLALYGRWPWPRSELARLTDELVRRQQIGALGFDLIFAEAERNPGLLVMEQLADGPLGEMAAFSAERLRMGRAFDNDQRFAQALAGGPTVLGFYFVQSSTPGQQGMLPPPVLPSSAFPPGQKYAPTWSGFGANISVLSSVAASGFINVLTDSAVGADGVVRMVPLLSRFQSSGAMPAETDGYYESLAMATYRLASRVDPPLPRFSTDPNQQLRLETLSLQHPDGATRQLPVDESMALRVAYRGYGGPSGGSFRYVSAADVLGGRLAASELAGSIVLVGTSAPGLQDLRVTPVGAAFPGVEVHANVISSLLDGRFVGTPDYAKGYDVLMIGLLGVLLALGLTLLSARRALVLSAGVSIFVIGLNHGLYYWAKLVLPQAGCLMMIGAAFALNMGWGYFVESRTRRELAQIFGTYVPPQLVSEMERDPTRYTMQAHSKELTVMFCDMRGFTALAEHMAPAQLQALLNQVFGKLAEIITRHRGTVDKYMGDCVMAFWGAPLDVPGHASLAVRAAVEMAQAVAEINRTSEVSRIARISVGIGVNSGIVSVGDMGSMHRRSYTVIGDAVNLAARIEGLGDGYGVDVVVGEATRAAAPDWLWQELDCVRVKGKSQMVAIFTPLMLLEQATDAQQMEINLWEQALVAFRTMRTEEARVLLQRLLGLRENNVLYRTYLDRVALMSKPLASGTHGATGG